MNPMTDTAGHACSPDASTGARRGDTGHDSAAARLTRPERGMIAA